MADPANSTAAVAHRWLWRGFVFLSMATAGLLCWHIGTALHDRSEFVHHHVGTPILFRERGLGWQRLRNWDWKHNRWIDIGPFSDDVDSVATFDGDRAVAFIEGKSLVITELSSPEARTTINLDSISRLAWGKLVGIGRDGRYAVLQKINDRLSPDGSRLVHALRVVDLHSRTLVDERFSDSYFIATNAENQFASQSLNVKPPHHRAVPCDGMWELSEDGQLRSIATLQSETPLQGSLFITQVDGTWRVIEGEAVRSATAPVHVASIVANRRDGKTSFAASNSGHYFQLDRDSGVLTRVQSSVLPYDPARWRRRSSLIAAYTPDEKAILAIDVNNTVAAIDSATGKTIAVNRAYSVDTLHYLLATIVALAFGAGWLYIAWRASTAGGCVSSCSAALFFCELALGVRLVVCRNYDSEFHHVVAACCAAALLGIVSGTTMSVGWLWAWGNFWQLKRWLLGTVIVIAITFPAAMGLSLWQTDFFATFFSEFGLAGIWVMMIRIALVITAGNSLLMGLPTLAHFRFAPVDHVGSKQYALSELFAGIAGLAMALALFRAGVSDSSESEATWLAGLAGASIVGGLAAMLLTTIRWPKFVSLMLFTATVLGFLGATVFLDVPAVPGITRFLGTAWEHVVNTIYFATALLAATGSLWLVRRQGWHWRRVAVGSSENPIVPTSRAVA